MSINIGAAVAPGPKGITNRKLWVSGTSYDPRSVVRHNGKLWYAEVATDAEPGTVPETVWSEFIDFTAAVEAQEGAEAAAAAAAGSADEAEASKAGAAAAAAAAAGSEDAAATSSAASQTARLASEAARDASQTARLASETARNQAVSSASSAGASAVAASTSASQAALDRGLAETAALAAEAFVSGLIFEDEASGVAAVADGDPFVVQGSSGGNTYVSLYRRDGSDAVFQGLTLPSGAFVAGVGGRASANVGVLPGMAEPPVMVDVSTADGRPLEAADKHGRSYRIGPGGRMRGAPAEWRGPRLGILPGVDGPARAVEEGDDGTVRMVVDTEGRSYRPGPEGRLRASPLQSRGPRTGVLPGMSSPPIEVEMRADGTVASAVDDDGVPWRARPSGRMAAASVEQRGLRAGPVLDMPEPPTEIQRARDGGLIEARWTRRTEVVERIATAGGWAENVMPVDAANLTVDGTDQSLELGLPAILVDTPGGPVLVPPTSVTSPPVSTVAATAGINISTNGWNYLPYANPRNLVVTRVSDGTVLEEGTDYAVDYDTGGVRHLLSSTAVLVSIAYDGAMMRVDHVSRSMATGAIAYTQGTENKVAPAQFEPAVPAGNTLLYKVFRWVDGAEIIPVHLYRKRLRINRMGREDQEIARSRRHLAPVIHKAARGGTVRLVVAGDSISALGAGTALESNGTVNGIRDRATYFAQRYDSAAMAQVQQYAPEPGAATASVREGPHQRVRKLLTDLGGVVDFRNMAIGATNSSADAGEFWHGTTANQLAAFSANMGAAGDVFHIDYGMNELGSTTTYQQVRQLAQLGLTAGSCVVILLPVRRSPFFLRDPEAELERWLFTCHQLAQVAWDLDVACVRTDWVFHPKRLGALGFADRQLCDCSYINHPGKAELDAKADLAEMIYR